MRRPRILRVLREAVEDIKEKGGERSINGRVATSAKAIFARIAEECLVTGFEVDDYRSYLPTLCFKYQYFMTLCFDDKLSSFSSKHLHFVTHPCTTMSDYAYCVDCESLVIYRHKVGECPHSEYRKATPLDSTEP
jgi:hypothetical protein